jgi:hypothetical protein
MLTACRDTGRSPSDSARAAFHSVPPKKPGISLGWDSDAGPLLIVSLDPTTDSIAVVLPEITDSTIDSVQGIDAPVTGRRFDLFGRSGRIASNVGVSPLVLRDSSEDCYSWPMARVHGPKGGWSAGFATGHAEAIKLDSIEVMSAADSAALTKAVVQAASTLPAAADPVFRGLPFRVRSAYTFQIDTTEVIVATVVRALNEEANPRIEYMLVVGERAQGVSAKFNVDYFNRTAGAEDSTQASEVLTAVRIGVSKRPIVVVSVAYNDGAKLALIERTEEGKWIATWESAYTDC